MSKNNSNTKLSISQTKPIPNSGQGKPLNVTLRNYQNIGIIGSLLALGYSYAGQKTGYLKPETAKKINQAALTGLFISAAPTVYKKVEQTNLLESIANGIVKISTNAISKI